MDILYLIGKESATESDELRYSLRSIEKYGINVGKVFVVGNKPWYINDKMPFIDCPDIGPSQYKHADMLNKILYACKNSDISDDFLISSDDHFYVKPTDFDNYPYFCKEELEETYAKYRFNNNPYHRAMEATLAFLKKHKLPTYNFAWHGNTHFNKTKFLSMEPLVQLAMSEYWGVEPTCLMLNAMCADPAYKFDITYRPDYKVYYGDIISVEDREVFSTSPRGYNVTTREFLEHKFKTKSKYEW